MREPPPHFDPLAVYDTLFRKQPKNIFGAIEIFRSLPWMLRYFDRRVPDEFWMLEGEGTDSVAIVACPCGIEPPPRVPFNRLTQCEGPDCGRMFFYDGKRVLVARPEVQA